MTGVRGPRTIQTIVLLACYFFLLNFQNGDK
uniref:Uncharacterized protein n=1 Tax=Lepeophtheirus salmonis TaxID=72036 RepID=A0A0K2TEZ5_LEPSM